MSLAPHLTLITPVMAIQRRDFSYDVPAQLNPTNANPLLDGEFVQINSSYQVSRGSAGEVHVPTYPVFTEQGRYDTQALGKVDILFLGGFEAETDLYTAAGLAVGSPLMVTDVTYGGLTRKALALAAGGGATHTVVGWVTRLLTVSGVSKMRFWNPLSPTYLSL